MERGLSKSRSKEKGGIKMKVFKRTAGFTLVELMAVIVILGIMSLMVTPKVLDLISKAGKDADLVSFKYIIKGADYYYLEKRQLRDYDTLTGGYDVFTELVFTGKVPDDAIVYITAEGQVAASAIINEVCYSKEFSTDEVSESYDLDNCEVKADEKVVINFEYPTEDMSSTGWYKKNFVVIAYVYGSDLLDVRYCQGIGSCVTETTSVVNEISFNVTEESKENIACVTVLNGAGVETSKCSSKMMLDKTAPVLGNLVDLNVGIDSSISLLSGVDATDNLSGILGVTTIPTSQEFDTSVAGSKTVTYTVYDNAGNTASGQRNVRVISGLSVNFSNDGDINNNGWYNENISATVSIPNYSTADIDSSKYCITSDSSCVGTIDFTESVTFEVGLESETTKICATISNIYGDVISQCSTTYKLDTTAPTISGIDDIRVNLNDSFSLLSGVIGNDSISGISGIVTNPSSIDTTAIGITEVTYTISDKAGNSSSAVRQIMVKTVADPSESGSDGIIPVTIAANGTVTISDGGLDWYDYDNQIWANGVLATSTYRTAAVGTVIPESAILAYFVWIPRYEYKINGETIATSINFIKKTQTTATSGYIVHPAFTFDGEQLSGIWVGKFDTSGTSISPTIKPNVVSLRSMTVSSQFITSMIFSGNTATTAGVISGGISTSTYGLVGAGRTSMIKNSEWGAVAYLSHSAYGKGITEVYINNNSDYYTGCGGTTVSASSSTSCTNQYGSITSNVYPQSTTGNISGVFDMSGGAWTRTMGVYIQTTGSSGFSTSLSGLDTKYYDNYTTTTSTTACSGSICYGHALSETSGWNSDLADFPYSSRPWFVRGGGYGYTTSAGVFSLATYTGGTHKDDGFRVVVR